MNVGELNGVEIALVLMGKDEYGEDDWAILKGKGVVKSGALYIHYGADQPLFPVPREAVGRIKKVTAEMSDMLLGADLCIPLTVGTVDEDIDPETLLSAGIAWPA